MRAPNTPLILSRSPCQPLQPILPHVPHHQQPGLPVGARPRDPPAHQVHLKELQVCKISGPAPSSRSRVGEQIPVGVRRHGEVVLEGREPRKREKREKSLAFLLCLALKSSLLAGAVKTVSARRAPSWTVCRRRGIATAPSPANT